MKKIIIILFAICVGPSALLFAQTTSLKGGTISSNQTINWGEAPAMLMSSVDASGNSLPITYSWELNTAGSDIWLSISGASSVSYTPQTLSGDTYFRRKAMSGNLIAYSNTVKISLISITNDDNFISTYTYMTENDSICVADVNYYDGLGYLSQSVSISASPEKKSIVSPIYYDAMKRESRQYLPYAVADDYGKNRPEALVEQVQYYNDKYGSNAGGYSYSESVYEASPLNRVTASYSVGNVFRANDKKNTFDYGLNAENEVMRFKINLQMLQNTGFYRASTLFKNTVINEDGTSAVTYKDFQDRIILERVVDSTDNHVAHDTYYVYDDNGNLCYVLPPKLSETAVSWASGIVADTSIKELAYIYKYDGHNRCIEKRLPGTEPIYMVYDKSDRLVMSQDGNMRDQNKWTYTKYDALSRPIRQSILINSETMTASTLQTNFNNAPVAKPYDPIKAGFLEDILLTKILYDGYYSEDETDIITMDQIPVGANIRGWTFKITQMELEPNLLEDEVSCIYLNGEEWFGLTYPTWDAIQLLCNWNIKATEEDVDSMYYASWSLNEGYTFTIKDDQDYIVTKNTLLAGDETTWGFDAIIKVK